MRAKSILLPVLVATSICGSFLAGQYIGRYDAEKRQALAAKTAQALQSSSMLQLAGTALVFLHDGKPTDATQVLEQYAKLQVDSVAVCLQSTECSAWVASTPETRARLHRYIAAASQVAPASSATR